MEELRCENVTEVQEVLGVGMDTGGSTLGSEPHQ